MTETGGVRVEDVTFSYGEAVLRFDLSIRRDAITAIMGPSGSGKSTLLNLIAGFETPASGRILIGETDVTRVPPSARPVSMVFQENNLFAHLDVAKNVGLGRSPSLALTAADRADIAQALERTGLAGKERRLPRELSGGERQRVAIARALVRNRPVLLMDEPFASLGPALREDMLDLVAGLRSERGMTVVLVTHQPQDARKIAEDMIFLENGAVTAAGKAADFFASDGPERFRHYMGSESAAADSPRIARKPT
jgi:thiamine transport system ATP-binding protein